ncbi:multidrug effflux MFS transporter [Palleronia caenipelagi]|nr:multidrug effflux MFS transporter [Palleronia caenipelagi]
MVALASLAAMSMNLFLPSLPKMTAYFGTSYAVMQITVAGYLGVNGVMQLVIGPLSDNLGRRRVLLWAIVIFVFATVGCLLSTHIAAFLIFRGFQAVIVAALILPRAAIRDLYPTNEAAAMIGYVTMGMSVAPMVAPAVGGALQGLFGWQASFGLLAILGVLLTWVAWRDMGETAARSHATLTQQFRQYPVLFRSPRFWGYAGTAAFCSGTFFAYLGGAPYVGSEIFGLTPTHLGLLFGAPSIGYFIGNGLTGRFAALKGPNRMIIAGVIVTAIGPALSLVLTFVMPTNPLTFFGPMILTGIGNGLVLPSATAGMMSVRPELAGTASGLGGAVNIGGGATLSALAGVLLMEAETALPLVSLMLASAVLSALGIVVVLLREARLSRG